MSRRSVVPAVLLSLLLACDSSVAPESAFPEAGLRPAVQRWTSLIGLPQGVPDYPSHVAASEPYAGSWGLWLGAEVTPAGCFRDLNPTGIGGRVDADSDWLYDDCEFKLASGFRPQLMIRNDCEGAEPYWAAKYFKEGPTRMVRIIYLLAYYDDCGNARIPFNQDTGHIGDKEWIMIDAFYHDQSRHWLLETIVGSRHGDPAAAPWNSENVRWGGGSSIRGYPQIAVADGKHANYFNDTQCDHDFWEPPLDHCAEPRVAGRVTVLPERNVGSVFASESQDIALIGDGTGCVGSVAPHADPARKECFTRVTRGFNGWYAGEGTGIGFRGTMMEVFRMRGTDAGPGPNPPPPVIYAGIDGPSDFPGNQWQTWTATVDGQVVWPVTYQWYVDDTPAGTSSTLSRNFDPGTSHFIQLVVVDAIGTTGSTAISVYARTECGGVYCEEWLSRSTPGSTSSESRKRGPRSHPILPRPR